jgi:hypothetical protein
MSTTPKIAAPVIEQLNSVIQRYTHTLGMQKARTLFAMTAASTTDDGASASPAPDNIMDVINKTKKAPSATSVLAVPAQLSAADVQNLDDISLLDTYVSVASAKYYYELNPNGPDITTADGAAQFTRSLANARLRMMTEGLAGVLSLGDSSAESFHKSTTSADLHFEFLNNIFSSFNFTPDAMKQLDGIMTNIVQNLGALQASWSDQSQTLDHMISVYYFEDVMGLAGARVPKMRLFFLHIDQRSWTLSIGKSSVSEFEFNMNYSDQIATMSLTQMAQSRDTIQQYVTDMTNQGFEAVKRLLAMSAVQQKDSSDSSK